MWVGEQVGEEVEGVVKGASEDKGGVGRGMAVLTFFFIGLGSVRYQGEVGSLQNRVFRWQYLRPGGTCRWEMRWRGTRLRRVQVSVHLCT